MVFFAVAASQIARKKGLLLDPAIGFHIAAFHFHDDYFSRKRNFRDASKSV